MTLSSLTLKVAGASCGVVLCLLLTGCSIGDGIANFGNNIANPPLVAIGGPGVRIATGHYSSPLVDPWAEEGPAIVAFEYLDDGPHLAMRPLDGTAGCDTGLAYSSVVRDKLVNLTQLIAYLGPPITDGRGPVHFVDHSCKEYGAPVQNANLPELLYSDPPGYLVDAGTELLVVDPWNGTSTVLAGNLTWWAKWSLADSSIAVIDGGHFKIFNAQQQVSCDLGTAVTEMALLSGQSGAFALVDGGTLRTYRSLADTAPVDIATDACKPVSDSGGCLFYFSPCAARQLQCYRADRGQSTPIDSGVNALISSRTNSGTTDFSVLYTKPNLQSNGFDLWLYTPGASPAMMVAQFYRLYAWSAPPALEIIALVNADVDKGQAIRHTSAGDVVLADSVSVQFSQGLLANFDVVGSIGDLNTPLQLGQTSQFVVAGVPFVPRMSTIVASKNANTVQYGNALISAAKGAVGNLTLVRYPTATSPGPALPRTVASNVPVGSYEFFEGMNALAYIENWKNVPGVGGTGSLVVHELELDARSNVSNDVREFQEVLWPFEGVMYIVPSGDQAGIWVARAK